jgi:hypothetical protein
MILKLSFVHSKSTEGQDLVVYDTIQYDEKHGDTIKSSSSC